MTKKTKKKTQQKEKPKKNGRNRFGRFESSRAGHIDIMLESRA